jgi:hypothetical protein
VLAAVEVLDLRQLKPITDQLHIANYASDDADVRRYAELDLQDDTVDKRVLLAVRGLEGREHSITSVYLPDEMSPPAVAACLRVMFPSKNFNLVRLHFGELDWGQNYSISFLRRCVRDAENKVKISGDNILDELLNDVAAIVNPPPRASAFQPSPTSFSVTNKSVLQSDFEESSTPKPIDKQWPVAGVANLLGDGAGARIAVLDTGVDPFHVDMRSIDLEVHSFVNTPSYYDWTSHGMAMLLLV